MANKCTYIHVYACTCEWVGYTLYATCCRVWDCCVMLQSCTAWYDPLVLYRLKNETRWSACFYAYLCAGEWVQQLQRLIFKNVLVPANSCHIRCHTNTYVYACTCTCETVAFTLETMIYMYVYMYDNTNATSAELWVSCFSLFIA